MKRPSDAVANEAREGSSQDASLEERERIRRIEDRQDFPGAVIAGFNDDVPPDYTPILDVPEPAADDPPTLPYGESED